jgi:hypothetical protein
MEDAIEVGLQNYWIEEVTLLFKHANTWERAKSKPFRLIQLALTPGEYLSEMGVGDMKSRCILYAMTPRN